MTHASNTNVLISRANLQHRTRAYVIGSVINHGAFIGDVAEICFLPELKS